MSCWDLLKEAVHTPLNEHYVVGGAVFAIVTNSEHILRSARESLSEVGHSQPSVDVSARLWVDPKAQAGPPWPRPYFRGLDHLVFAGLDIDNSLLINLRRPHVIGRFSATM